MELFLCRHGQTEHNSTDTVQGQSESKLTEKGLAQAEKLKERFEKTKIDFLYSSSMPRARKTAKIVARPHEIEVKESDEIKEICRAEFEGQSFEKLVREIEKSEVENHLWKPENGENLEELQTRSVKFIEKLKKQHKSEKVVVVSHSGTIGAAIMGLIDHSARNSWKLQQDNCCVNKLNWSDKRGWMVESVNDVSHL